MPIRSNLRLVLAELNVAREQRGEAALSLRQPALAAGATQRIDFNTIDRLLTYLNQYLAVDAADLLPWTPPQDQDR